MVALKTLRIFFSGLIRSAKTDFFLKWLLNIFINYLQFERGLQQSHLNFIRKVGKILKGNLDSIPSVKIQIMGWAGKFALGVMANLFEFSLRVKVMGLNPGYLLKSYLL